MKIVVIAGKDSAEGAVYVDLLLRKGLRPQLVVLLKRNLKSQVKLLRYYFRAYDLGNFSRAVTKALLKKLGLSSPEGKGPAKHSIRPLMELIRENEIKYLFVPALNGSETLDALQAAGPDIVIARGVGIIGRRLLSKAGIGFINAHPGILPKYRGNNPVEWTLLNGDSPGVTIHFMDESIDTGDIIACKYYDGPVPADLAAFRWNIFLFGAGLLVETIESIAGGHYTRTPQAEGRYWPQLPWKLRKTVLERLKQYAEGKAG